MRTLVLSTLFIVVVFADLLNAQSLDSIITLLSSKSWEKASDGINLINKNLEKFRDDASIRNAVAVLFKRETDYLRKPTNKTMENPHGESEGDVAFLIVKIDLKEAIFDLIDWVNNSFIFDKYLVNHCSLLECDSGIFDTIFTRFNRQEEFYELRRDGYMVLSCHLVDSLKNKCEKQNNFAKSMVLSCLSDTVYEMSRLIAVENAYRFLADPRIVSRLRYLSENDSFSRGKKEKKVYPVREAAQKVLLKINN
jgi:hypothetical protein